MPKRKYLDTVNMAVEVCSGSWAIYQHRQIQFNLAGRPFLECRICGEYALAFKRGKSDHTWTICEHDRFSPTQPKEVWPDS